MDWETEARIAAFRHLSNLEQFDTLIPGRVLAEGFSWQGRTITLKGQTGIWTPKGFSCPISITSRASGPYDLDGIEPDLTIIYAYRGTDPNQRDNRNLRLAYETRTPLIFFKEVLNHLYQPIWPIRIIEDHPDRLFVKASMEPAYRDLSLHRSWGDYQVSSEEVRRYEMVETDTACTRADSGRWSSMHIVSGAPCATCDTGSCSMPRTSFPMQMMQGFRR